MTFRWRRWRLRRWASRFRDDIDFALIDARTGYEPAIMTLGRLMRAPSADCRKSRSHDASRFAIRRAADAAFAGYRFEICLLAALPWSISIFEPRRFHRFTGHAMGRCHRRHWGEGPTLGGQSMGDGALSHLPAEFGAQVS